MESSSHSYVKVFGERNTGTNWLCQLLKANTSMTVLGDGGKPNFKPRLKHILASYRISDALALKLIKEKLLDAEREQHYPLYYGWKHAAIDSSRISSTERFHDTLFLCIVRNPWRFVSGLHKRPYNLAPPPVSSLSDFVSAPLLLNYRDGIPDLYVSNPVEIWNKKVSSYYNFYEDHPINVRVIRYEDLVANPEIIKDQLSGLTQFKFDSIKIPKDSTKSHRGDAKTYDDYKKEVIAYDPCESLGRELAHKIFSLVDVRLMCQTGYDSLYNPIVD
ncbi:hypothetical protein [Vulcanococcus sp. Clear-D1]|uniref:hypothetical protein n=1 Tax=Vulcanococcus sp. Clear-D1 TaxID=2766970 RepID=UPI0019A7BB35|nr:hypothetical protein [Vulcanococcus sp. Clear-D1]MBD1194985.1 hypothetical protein [Vulcanococcus sp. Clear-D1]